MKRVLSEEQLRIARELREQGLPWAEIGRQLGTTAHPIRRALDPGYSERHREWSRRRARPLSVDGRDFSRVRVPREVEEERDRALSITSRSATAELLGDPLPGRSALDRRGDGCPTVSRDF